MANKYIRIGSMNNIHIFDDGDFDGAIETDDTMKAHQAPVADEDVLRLVDIGDIIGNVFAPAGGSTNDEVVRFDGVTGALLKSSATPVIINAAGSITLPNGATIGQAAGPLIAFDDTNNYLEITGCFVGIGTTAPTSPLQVVGLTTYANDAAALAGGLTSGAFYKNGADPDLVCVVK